jgi:hypothetical protein
LGTRIEVGTVNKLSAAPANGYWALTSNSRSTGALIAWADAAQLRLATG